MLPNVGSTERVSDTLNAMMDVGAVGSNLAESVLSVLHDTHAGHLETMDFLDAKGYAPWTLHDDKQSSPCTLR